MTRIKLFAISFDVTYELLAQDDSTFHTHRNHIIPYYPKEPIILSHIQNYKNLSSSIINNPDLDSYQEEILDNSILNSPQNTSEITIPPSIYDTSELINQDSGFNDESNFSDSDSYMHDNPLYSPCDDIQPNSQIYPRVADTSHEYFHSPQIYQSDNRKRNRQTPYNLRPLPRKNYHESQTRIDVPP